MKRTHEQLPGRKHPAGSPGEVAVAHYAERINARKDLTPAEKAEAIRHYAESMGVKAPA